MALMGGMTCILCFFSFVFAFQYPMLAGRLCGTERWCSVCQDREGVCMVEMRMRTDSIRLWYGNSDRKAPLDLP